MCKFTVRIVWFISGNFQFIFLLFWAFSNGRTLPEIKPLEEITYQIYVQVSLPKISHRAYEKLYVLVRYQPEDILRRLIPAFRFSGNYGSNQDKIYLDDKKEIVFIKIEFQLYEQNAKEI